MTQQRGARPPPVADRGARFRPAPPRVRRLRVVGVVVGGMTIASVVVVVVLWLVQGNVRDFGTDGAGQPPGSAGSPGWLRRICC